MKRLRMCVAPLVLVTSLGLAACNGGGSSSTTPSQIANLSGDYSGTMQDAQAGTGTAAATLAQHGSSAGGSITAATPGGTLTAQISLAITPSNALSGAIVIDESSGVTCTFKTTGTYDPTTNVVTGSYTAVTNCSGDTGTYTLTQQCVDTITSAARRTLGLAHC